MAIAVEGERLIGTYEPQQAYLNPSALSAEQVLTHACYFVRDPEDNLELRMAASVSVDPDIAEFARALFPRDWNRSLVAAPELRSQYIEACTKHMSFKDDAIRDSGVGKIFHELREWEEDLPESTKLLFLELEEKWTRRDQQSSPSMHVEPKNVPRRVIYGGAVDVTADYFINVIQEAKEHPEILNRTFYNDDLGRKITVREAARAAIGWVVNEIVVGANGVRRHFPTQEYLLEAVRQNPRGTIFQNITDGDMSTIHTQGHLRGVLGNYHQPVAHLEVQLGAIRALEEAAQAENLDFSLEERANFRDIANKVWESTMRCFYMPDKQYFAAAVDHDEVSGAYRPVETYSMMAASILHSTFLDRLPEDKRQRYVSEIASTLLSDKFITDIGLRVLSKEYWGLLQDPENTDANVTGYQNEMANWYALIFDAIQGLHKHGLHNAATQLENRVLNFVHSTSNAEFGLVGAGKVRTTTGEIVDIDDVVVQHFKTRKQFDALSSAQQQVLVGDRKLIVLLVPYPQDNLLMTAAAVLKIKQDREAFGILITESGSWQDELEHQIFAQPSWKHIEQLHGEALKKWSNNGYFFIIDNEQGRKAEERMKALSESQRALYAQRRRTGTSQPVVA